MRVWDEHRRVWTPRQWPIAVGHGLAVGVACFFVSAQMRSAWAVIAVAVSLSVLGAVLGCLGIALRWAHWRVRHPARYPCCEACPVAMQSQIGKQAQRQREVAQWQ